MHVRRRVALVECNDRLSHVSTPPRAPCAPLEGCNDRLSHVSTPPRAPRAPREGCNAARWRFPWWLLRMSCEVWLVEAWELLSGHLGVAITIVLLVLVRSRFRDLRFSLRIL